MGNSVVRWMTAMAAHVGRGHARFDIPCQDYVGSLRAGRNIAIALADGAGSARYAEQGARSSVESVLKLLVSEFENLRCLPMNVIRREVLKSILSDLRKLKRENESLLRDYACTLLFVVTNGERYLIGQIGDGVVGILNENKLRLALKPSKGEFINETVFVTSRNARKFFQIKKGMSTNLDGVILMSDGSAESLFDRKSNSFGVGANRMMHWLESHCPLDVETAYIENLQNILSQRTTDDCSIAVLRKVQLRVDDMKSYNDSFVKSFLNRKTKIGVDSMIRMICEVGSETDFTKEIIDDDSFIESSLALKRRNLKFIREQLVIK